MTRASRRFDNRLKRFRALVVALNAILVGIVTQAQQPSTKVNNQQPTTATPAQLPQDSTGPRRIQALLVTEAITSMAAGWVLPYSNSAMVAGRSCIGIRVRHAARLPRLQHPRTRERRKQSLEFPHY